MQEIEKGLHPEVDFLLSKEYRYLSSLLKNRCLLYTNNLTESSDRYTNNQL
jgi:hypothetical protein